MASIGRVYWDAGWLRKGWLRKAGCVAIVLTFGALGSTASALGAPPRLLVLGDSLTAGFGLAHDDGFQVQLQQALKARGHQVIMIDGAVSGDTSAGGRARLDWALGDGADAAIVELGANDGLRGLDPKDMAANLGCHPGLAWPLNISRSCSRGCMHRLTLARITRNPFVRYLTGLGSGRACCMIRSSWRVWRCTLN